MNAVLKTSSHPQSLDLAAFKLKATAAEPFIAKIPGSKSYTNRALVLAAQRMGRTEIVGALHSEDTDLLAACLNAFGGLAVEKTQQGFTVVRTSEELTAPEKPVFVGGGGTPARLLIAFAAMAKGETTVDGNARLRERPMGDLLDALTGMGVQFRCLATEGCLPVKITGGVAIEKTAWRVNASKSSQFLTSLLLLAAQQKQPVTVQVDGDLVSKSYVEMTLQIMRDCGLRVEHEALRTFTVWPGMPNKSTIHIEVDASAMSYFAAAAALTRTTVVIPGITQSSKQGDAQFATLMGKMGASVVWHADSVEVKGVTLRGITVDMDTMPDTVLTLAAVASQAEGNTRVTNIANLKIKECDRIHAIEAELNRLGSHAVGGDDSVDVRPTDTLTPGSVQTYNDHRVAMAFSLLGLVHDGIRIEDPKCVEKSFPSYWTELARFVAHHNQGSGPAPAMGSAA
ncbi:3-phosphoshikimate 1-carboxyvinyltransferase [Ramlibacter sp.]|uniref:3-phosphoshikimate 1-carboxyvinyltransferase n=1 Tax=Ramlibacter sp. TaxID=1917967 RepID=UPI00181812D4|nr:3-phosphoshikimate 1-carboxyvinyltransferase [Ramlibacter sp.]MBA2672384.1 3-phosphoshikimate 1-carboxyvinyltransferase [Ramlibacter sp.]